MTPRHVSAEYGMRRQNRMLLRQRVTVLSAVFLALGVAWVAIGFFRPPAPEAVGYVSAGNDSVETAQAAVQIPLDPAQLPVGIAPAVQGPGRVTIVGPAALRAPVHWDDGTMRTVDGDPGGTFQWDSATGRVKVCDDEEDGHLVRAEVTVDGEVVRARDGGLVRLRAAGYEKCVEKRIDNYKRAEKKKYEFEVCLARSDDHPDGYCNTSNGGKWPKVDKEEDYCESSDLQGSYTDCVGGAEEACHRLAGPIQEDCLERNGGGVGPGEIFSTEKPDVAGPPGGRAPSLNDRPDASLPDGPASGYDDSKMAKPARKLLQWLTWATLGACVAGFMMVGANMAIKHKKGEVGEHAADLGWVLIATVVAGTGLAIYFVGLVVIPI